MGREGGRCRRRRAAGTMAESNADWMGSLPAALRSYPLSNLAIPGKWAGRRGRVEVLQVSEPLGWRGLALRRVCSRRRFVLP